MNANDLVPTPHIEAADLNGVERVVTITGVDFHEVGEEKQVKGVIFFAEFGSRGMVLNRTNLKRIIGIYGNETDDWTGKQVTLYPSETEFKGETVPCLRIRPEAPEPKKARKPRR